MSPGWSKEIVRDCDSWILRYGGSEPLSQALNQLIIGPTTLDCGMWSVLTTWFAMRYVVGDDWFDKLFPFKESSFVLTQICYSKLNKERTRGNLLHYFYDAFPDETFETTSETNLQARTVYNHRSYLAKHPGGADRLQNIIQTGAKCIIFDPLGPNVLSMEELDRELMKALNEQQTPADLEQVQLFETNPEYLDPRYKLKSWGDLARLATGFANYTLTLFQWNESLQERVKIPKSFRKVFNIARLIECMTEVRDWVHKENVKEENVEGEVFRIGKGKESRKFTQALLSSLKQTKS
jgi:hypothetical protein